MLHCYIYCVKYKVGIDEKCAGVSHVSLSDELGFICHLAFKQGFFSCCSCQKNGTFRTIALQTSVYQTSAWMNYSECASGRTLPDIWKYEAAHTVSAYICLHKIRCHTWSLECWNMVGGALVCGILMAQPAKTLLMPVFLEPSLRNALYWRVLYFFPLLIFILSLG